MPEFISKVQYKNYEKGEFTDESVRSPAEIIQVVKNFPWESERGADIQMTGPSVTVRSDDMEYLKIALYFNGKFAVYFLDRDNHVYESHTETLDDALQTLQSFLTGSLQLDGFDKHLFNIGNRAHFETGNFQYTYTVRRFLWVNLFLIIYLAFPLTGLIITMAAHWPLPALIFLAALTLIVGIPFWMILRFAFINRNNCLELSKGHDNFSFGLDDEHVKNYSKSDIRDIVIYSTQGSRSPISVEIYDITFNNDECIRLSNMLLSGFAFPTKFSNNMDKPLVNIIYGKKSLLKVVNRFD